MHLPPLPQELIDAIIDETCLSGDIHDLNSLSQVSRAFLPRTRDHLFRQVRLTSCRQCRHFRAICCSSPSVAHHVKTLTLNFFYYNKLSQSMELADVLARLSDVDDIVIEGFQWGGLRVLDQALLSHPFRSITLCDASFPDLNALCKFIDASPGLRSLSMSSVGIVDKHELREHVHVEPVEISMLSVGGRQDVMFDAMILHACPVSLNRLRCAVMVLETSHDFHVLKDILSVASCFLEELTVLHRPFEDGSLDSTDLPEHIDIPHVHAIKLALWDHHSARVEGDSVDGITLEWWISVLQSCDELERLQIQLFLRRDAIFQATYDFSIWSSLDVCLSHLPYFRRLTCVVNMSWPLAPPPEVGRLYMKAIDKEFTNLKKYRLFDIDVHGCWKQGKDCTC